MTWTRIDDDWTDMPVLAELDFADRWHLLAMIQFCSRTQQYDGILRAADARRCSDHPDPGTAIQNLVDRGLVAAEGEGFKLTMIEDHMPPPSVRAASAQTKVRMQRSRAHKNGDHRFCLPANCGKAPKAADPDGDGNVTHPVTRPVTRNVTPPVTRNTSTVQHSTDTATDTGHSLDVSTSQSEAEAQAVWDSTPSKDRFACTTCSQGTLTDSLVKRGKTSCRDCEHHGRAGVQTVALHKGEETPCGNLDTAQETPRLTKGSRS